MISFLIYTFNFLNCKIFSFLFQLIGLSLSQKFALCFCLFRRSNQIYRHISIYLWKEYSQAYHRSSWFHHWKTFWRMHNLECHHFLLSLNILSFWQEVLNKNIITCWIERLTFKLDSTEVFRRACFFFI